MGIKDKHQKIYAEAKPKGSFREQINDELNGRYKTELCKNWIEGKCNFGEFCNFAHGECELTTVNKSVCKQFQNYGYCLKGSNCLYIHIERVKGEYEMINDINRRRALIFNSINWE
ncbi:unnamed protein product [Blepharisma stoltei]|uniref:C3H1-type domain-containing protein n=1 Tax=Blepharisma stoltei TaxID=1481888 RepID=A0AAU9KK75_9CILI|nr:unnamed protein product [Blepharisma stoltei]